MHRQQIKHLITCICNIGKISFGFIWCISGLWYNGNSCLSGVNKMNLVRLMRVVCMVCVVRLVCRMHGVGRQWRGLSGLWNVERCKVWRWIGLVGTGIGIGTGIGTGGIDKSSKVLKLLLVVDMICLRRWVKMAKDSIVLKVLMYLNWWRRINVGDDVVVTSKTLNVVVHVFVGISITNVETKNTFST